MAKFSSISFSELIKQYSRIQSQLLSQLSRLVSSTSTASPSKFLLIQFAMSQVTQVGDSISNLISQVNHVINNAVRNQKSS